MGEARDGCVLPTKLRTYQRRILEEEYPDSSCSSFHMQTRWCSPSRPPRAGDRCSRRRSPVLRVAYTQSSNAETEAEGLRPRAFRDPTGRAQMRRWLHMPTRKLQTPSQWASQSQPTLSKAYCMFHHHPTASVSRPCTYHDALYNTPSKQKQKEIKGSFGATVTQHRVAFTGAGLKPSLRSPSSSLQGNSMVTANVTKFL